MLIFFNLFIFNVLDEEEGEGEEEEVDWEEWGEAGRLFSLLLLLTGAKESLYIIIL